MAEIDVNNLLAMVEKHIDEQSYSEAIFLCKEALRDLEDARKSEENERNKLRLLFTLSDICHISGNWVDGLMYLSTVIKKSSQLGDPNIKSEAIIRSGDIYSKMGKWDKALEKFDEGENSVRQFKDQYLLGRVYFGRGVVYWRQANYDKALDYANQAYHLGRGLQNQDLIARAASLRASIHYDLHEYEEAIGQNDLAFEAYRNLKNKIDMARVLNNKGEVYKKMGDYSTAINVFKDGLDILSESMNKRSLGYLYTNLAECEIRQGDVKKAKATSKEAEDLIRLLEDRYINAQLSMVLGLIAHNSHNSALALKHLQNAETIMHKLNIPYDLGVIQLEYARILRESDKSHASKEYQSAIESFRKAETLEMVKIAEEERESLGFSGSPQPMSFR